MKPPKTRRAEALGVLGGLLPLLLLGAAGEKPKDADYLSAPELFELMEKSKVKYVIRSLEELREVKVEEFASVMWPAIGGDTAYPWVEVSGDGSKHLRSYPLEEGCTTLVAQAEAHYEKKEYAEAAGLYEKATRDFPRCYVAYLYAGDAWLFRDKPAEALLWYDKAIELNPYDFRGPFFKATALRKLGRGAEAREAYVRALALRPHRESVLKAIRQNASELGIRFDDVPFLPQTLARQEGKKVAIYVGPDRPYWLVYGMCKAVWLAEPQHRTERTGTEDRQWSLTEERQCLASLLDNYFGLREKKEVPADPALDRLFAILRHNMIDGFVLYEIAYRVSPDALRILPDDLFQQMLDYVRTFVVVAEAQPEEGPPGR